MTEEKRGQMEEGLALQVQEEQALGQVTSQSSPQPHSEMGAMSEPVCWRRKPRLQARQQWHWPPRQHRG